MKKVLILVFSCITFFSCGKKEVVESTSRFMIVHAAPNTPDMQFYIDHKPIILQPLKYTSNIYYRDILSGIRNFKVEISGDVKIDTNMNFDKGDIRSIFFYDKPTRLKMKVVPDSLRSVASGFCRARFFQFVPDGGELDLINTIDNKKVFANTNLGEYKDWVNLPAGIYNFQLANSNNQTDVYTDWKPDTLVPGKNYTIIANGFQNTQTDDTVGVWLISNGEF